MAYKDIRIMKFSPHREPLVDDCSSPNLDLIVVFDNTNRLPSRRNSAVNANRYLLLDVLGSLKVDTNVRVSVISFDNSSPKVTIEFTDISNRDTIFSRIENIKVVRRKPSYTNAVIVALEYLDSEGIADAHAGLVILGSGKSDDSHDAQKAVGARIRETPGLTCFGVDTSSATNITALKTFTGSASRVYPYQRTSEFAKQINRMANAANSPLCNFVSRGSRQSIRAAAAADFRLTAEWVYSTPDLLKTKSAIQHDILGEPLNIEKLSEEKLIVKEKIPTITTRRTISTTKTTPIATTTRPRTVITPKKTNSARSTTTRRTITTTTASATTAPKSTTTKLTTTTTPKKTNTIRPIATRRSTTITTTTTSTTTKSTTTASPKKTTTVRPRTRSSTSTTTSTTAKPTITTTAKKTTATRPTTTKTLRTRRPTKATTRTTVLRTTTTTISTTSRAPTSPSFKKYFLKKYTEEPDEPSTTFRPGCLLDVIIVLDASGSVEVTFKREKELAADIVSRLRIGPNNSRVSIIKFAGAQQVKTVWSFADVQSKEKILRVLDSVPFNSGTTAIHSALLKALSEYTSDRGARPSIARPIAIVFTDGFGQKPTSTEAAMLRAVIPDTYAIAINHNFPISRFELGVIVGDPQRVFTDANIGKFHTVLDSIASDCTSK